MPQIPFRRTVGVPRESLRVVRPATADFSGVEALARTVGAAADESIEKRDRLNYNRARGELLRSESAARRALESEDDYTTYEDAYSKAMDEAQERAGGMILDSGDRALFEQDALSYRSQGMDRVHTLQRKRKGEHLIGDLDKSLEATREEFLLAEDDATRSELARGAVAEIDALVAENWISFDDGVELRQKWLQDAAEGYMTVLPPEAVSDALSGDMGKLIPADRRKVIADRANTHIAQRASARATAQKAADEANHRTAYDVIEADPTRGIEGIPDAVWQRMTGTQRNAARKYADSLVANEKIETDLRWYQRLQDMSDEELSAIDMMDYRFALSPSHFKQWSDRQAAVRNTDPVKIKGYRTQTQVAKAALDSVGIEADDPLAPLFHSRLDAAVIAAKMERVADGKPEDLPLEEFEYLANNLLREEIFDDGGFQWWHANKRRFEINERYEQDDEGVWRERESAPEDVSVPDADRRAIETALRRDGRAVTEAEVQRVYRLSQDAE